MSDIRAQCAGATLEFGFDGGNSDARQSVAVSGLLHGDRRLDYAILALADKIPGTPAPLPLREAALAIDPADPFPVNIIQHPRRAAKQVALRNNLVVAQQGDRLAYFTDTETGSSGSPVCDDVWRVVALHRNATQNFGNLTFQGRDTAWINVGTPIALIIADLRTKGAVWEAIGATLV